MAASQGNLSDVYKASALNRKRAHFVYGLPSEHQRLFTNADRFIIPNASLQKNKGTKDFSKAIFRKEEPLIIHIASYEGLEKMDKMTRYKICAYALNPLYAPDWDTLTNPMLAETLGALGTILCTYTPFQFLLEAGLATVMDTCNMVIKHKEWHSLLEVDEDTKEYRDTVAKDMGLDKFETQPQSCMVVALSILILIGKNVTDANREGWFRNRWRALANICNVSIDADRIKPPVLRACQAIYSSSSANQPVRSTIFKIIRSLSRTVDNQNHVIFDRIMQLLQWAESSHLWMIFEFVFMKHPDVLVFPELTGPEVSAMLAAIEFLKTFPVEDRPFLKLLIDHNELKPLQSNQFVYFTAAAHAISAMTKTSMLNINSRFSEEVKAFQSRIVNYINEKNKIGELSAAVQYTDGMNPIIQKKLIKSIESASVDEDITEFVDQHPEARE